MYFSESLASPSLAAVSYTHLVYKRQPADGVQGFFLAFPGKRMRFAVKWGTGLRVPSGNCNTTNVPMSGGRIYCLPTKHVSHLELFRWVLDGSMEL